MEINRIFVHFIQDYYYKKKSKTKINSCNDLLKHWTFGKKSTITRKKKSPKYWDKWLMRPCLWYFYDQGAFRLTENENKRHNM